MTLRLLSYNIRFGGVGREDAIAEAIKSVAPDLVVFQEATHPHVIARIASIVGYPFWAARERHSIGFLSQREIAYHEWHYPAGARHSFLEIVPLLSEQSRIFGLHLSARFSKWDERRRAREIRSLLDGVKRHQDGFHVLVGDYNTLAPGEDLELAKLPAWIRGLIWISGRKLQRDTIQVALDAGYLDCYRMRHKEEKGYTFPTWDPHVRLDYAFVPKTFADRILQCEVITEPESVMKAASDHLPLLVELNLD
ncbi:MAG TPA: endonuclease/exonuclease/phosphatase family protein [Pyrinomonadaceae bacterium]|nr:endonuclease/exonuclease/phosphatase family protein [Pyrinomonadaceae bacterium]